MTDEVDGDLFAIGTILGPANKLQFFTGKDWEGDWRERYHQSLQAYLEPYRQRLSDKQLLSHARSSAVQTSELDIIVQQPKHPRLSQHDELTQYLESGKCAL